MSGFGIFTDALDMTIPTGMLSRTHSAMKITSGMVQPIAPSTDTCDPASKSASISAGRGMQPDTVTTVTRRIACRGTRGWKDYFENNVLW